MKLNISKEWFKKNIDHEKSPLEFINGCPKRLLRLLMIYQVGACRLCGKFMSTDVEDAHELKATLVNLDPEGLTVCCFKCSGEPYDN